MSELIEVYAKKDLWRIERECFEVFNGFLEAKLY